MYTAQILSHMTPLQLPRPMCCWAGPACPASGTGDFLGGFIGEFWEQSPGVGAEHAQCIFGGGPYNFIGSLTFVVKRMGATLPPSLLVLSPKALPGSLLLPAHLDAFPSQCTGLSTLLASLS